MEQDVLESQRLFLLPFRVRDYEIYALNPEDDFLWQERGIRNSSRHLMDDAGALPWRAPQVLKNLELAPLLMRLVVEKSSMEVIGSIGFHLPPDERGMLEIGFTVIESRRNEGFGNEMLHTMWAWAAGLVGVEVFRYTTSPDNAVSQHIIRKLGFEHVGVQLDEIDGPEDIYEMSVKTYLDRFANI